MSDKEKEFISCLEEIVYNNVVYVDSSLPEKYIEIAVRFCEEHGYIIELV